MFSILRTLNYPGGFGFVGLGGLVSVFVSEGEVRQGFAI